MGLPAGSCKGLPRAPRRRSRIRRGSDGRRCLYSPLHTYDRVVEVGARGDLRGSRFSNVYFPTRLFLESDAIGRRLRCFERSEWRRRPLKPAERESTESSRPGAGSVSTPENSPGPTQLASSCPPSLNVPLDFGNGLSVKFEAQGNRNRACSLHLGEFRLDEASSSSIQTTDIVAADSG